IPIFPSDVVNIPPRTPVKVFCLGEVKAPGALEFDSDDRISLLSVIAKAGGLTDRASNSIRIKRRGPDGRDVETVVNFRRIVSGKDRDPVLLPDDVVIIKESFFQWRANLNSPRVLLLLMRQQTGCTWKSTGEPLSSAGDSSRSA